jgi:hypothetical protein
MEIILSVYSMVQVQIYLVPLLPSFSPLLPLATFPPPSLSPLHYLFFSPSFPPSLPLLSSVLSLLNNIVNTFNLFYRI